MKIQLVSRLKLKVQFDLDDLEENNITLHSFLSGSQKSKTFFKAILEIAEEDFEIDILNKNFSYETFCFNFSKFIIIVSILDKTIFSTYSSENYNKENSFSRDSIVSSISSFKFIDNNLLNNISLQNLYYIFNDIGDFLEFSNYSKIHLKNFKIDSVLYKYKNIFLLEIITTKLSKIELDNLILLLSETKNSLTFSEISITHIKEFSKIESSINALGL